MPKWIVNLTDEDKEGLERIRVYLGLKSHAEAFRAILRKFDGRDEPLPVTVEAYKRKTGELASQLERTGSASQQAADIIARREADQKRMAGWFAPKGKGK